MDWLPQLFTQHGALAIGWIVAVAEAGFIVYLMKTILGREEEFRASMLARADATNEVIRKNTETAAIQGERLRSMLDAK